MPRVLRIINRLNLGGPTYNAALLTKHLAPEFETLLVAGTKTDTEESSEFIVKDLGIDHVSIPEMSREISLTKDYIAYKKIKQIIRDFKPDIVHTHSAKAGTLGRLAASSLNVRVIVHTFHGHVFHSYFNPLKTRIFLSIERYLAKKSTAIIALSGIQKHELAVLFRICPPDKIKVIQLGFDLTRFRERMEEKRKDFRKTYSLEDELAIGIIGRLVPVKNHTLFLHVFNQIRQKTNKKVRAFIIGDGEERNKLEALAASLGISFADNNEAQQKPSLIFTSWIKNIDWAIAGLDIIAMTSLNEGTPVSLIEAQASGKPIVSTNVGGIENIVQPGITGLLSESTDEKGFTENLLRIVENQNLRNSLGASGWKNVGERFNYTRLVNEIKTLYYELLNTKQ